MPSRSGGGNLFGQPTALLRGLAAKTVPVAPADPAVQATAAKLARRTLYLDTVSKVRSGTLSSDQGYARLKGAGLADAENPFTNRDAPGIGGVAHALAAPLGLSRSSNIKADAAQTRANIVNAGDPAALTQFDKTGAAPIKYAPKKGGVISPGTGLIAQTLAGAADKSVYAPAGTYDAITHPLRTGEQIVHHVEHVVEHPGSDPAAAAMLAWAALSGGGAALSRIAGASRALKAGEGVGAAAVRPSSAGGSLLHTPAPAPRTFQVGGAELHLLPSHNPALRAAQTVHDRLVQRAIAENPEGAVAGYGTRRLGNALAETRRYTQPMQATPAQILNRSGRKLDKAEQAALRLTAENSTPEERIALHEQQAQAGVDAKAQAQQIKLLTAVRKRGLVTQDEHGNVVIDAAKHPELAAIDAQLSKVGESMAGTVERTGQMTSDAIASRADRPNVVTATGEPVTEEMLHSGAAHQLSLLSPEARPGRQYVPYFGTEAKGGLGAIARGGSRVVGRARPVISPTQHMTGEALLQGLVPDNTTGLVARAAERQTRYENTDTFRRTIVQAGSDTRQTTRDVLVNTQELKNAHVPEEIQAAIGAKHVTLDELGHHATAFEKWRQQLVPGFAGEKDASIGAAAPEGFRWVDKHLLGDLANPTPIPSAAGAKVAKGFDTINAAQTAATVYFKPGHIATRALTNAATNIIQGSATPLGIGRSVRLWHELGPETRMSALAAAGEGGIHAMPAEAMNVVGKVARAGALWWSKHFDSPFRFNSLAYEARKAGITTPQQFKQMLVDMEHPERLTPERAARVDAIAKNANREAIAYDRLSDFEKRYIRRALWFYPWLKGATVFAGRVVLEHPFKAALVGELGTVGQQNAEHDLGPVPSYERGLFKVGGSDALPLVVNPNSVSPFSTPAEIVEAALHANHPTEAEQLSSFLTPGLSLAAHEAFHLGPFGQQLPASTSSAEILKQEVGGQTPEVTLARRLEGPHAGSMFPVSRAQALEQFGAGAVSPKTADRAVLNTQAENERLAAMPPVDRAGAHVTNEQHTLDQQAQTLGLHLPPELAHVYEIQQQRAESYARLGPHASQQAKLHADLLLAVHLGDLSEKDAEEMLATAATAPPAEIEKARRQMNDAFFGAQALGQIRSAVKQATAAKAAHP